MNHRAITIAFATLVAGACSMPNPSPRLYEKDGENYTNVEPRVRNSAPETPVTPEATPVKGDGSLVPAEPPGTVRVVEEPLREVEGVSTGRVWLLELYHGALADKEGLARRLEASDRERAGSAQQVTNLTAERDALTARCAGLDARVRELEAQSLELALRLSESEIARLELEKAALEREARNDRKERP